MTTNHELQPLLDHVRAATGPDRELDVALECMAGDTYSFGHRPSNVFGKVVHYYNSTGRSGVYKAPRYTLSIDAALAFTERVLPGWDVIVRKYASGIGFAGVSEQTDEETLGYADATGRTPELAILAAALTALIARASA